MRLLSTAELRDMGVLQEINRQVLHPLGLAMMVELDTNGIFVIDNSADPEGVLYESFSAELVQVIAERRKAKMDVRVAAGCCDDQGIQQKPARRS